MNIFENKYIKNFFSLLFFLSVLWIMMDSVLRTTISSYLVEEKIFLGIIGAIYLIYFILQLYVKKINVVSILFLVLVAVSLLSSLTNGLSFEHCFTSVFYHLSLIFVFSFFSYYKKILESRFRFILILLSFILFGYALVNLLLYFITTYQNLILNFDTWVGLGYNNRLIGVTGNPAVTGVLAYMGIITQVYLLSSSNKKLFMYFISIIFFAIELPVLILSDARGSLIALSLLFLLCFINVVINNFQSNKVIKYIFFIILFIIVTCIMIFLVYDILKGRRDGFQICENFANVELFLDKISSLRYSLWKESLVIISQKPLLGIGIDNLAPYATIIIPGGIISQRLYEGPHNVLLDVAVSSGLIGLAISLVIFFYIFRSCYILMKKQYTLSNVVLVAGIVGMFIISLFDYGIFFRGRFMSPLFWMFSGYAYCLSKRVKS